MNKVIIMGRLAKEPNVNTTSSGLVIARYTVAVDRRTSKDATQTADFISCVSFGKQGELVQKYVHKGTKILLTGRIQTGSYTNKEGQKVYTTDVISDEVEFVESKKTASENRVPTAPTAETAITSNINSADNGFLNVPESIDDGLPFS